MLPAKILLTIVLMGSIPMWIRMVTGSPAEIGTVRLTWGLLLTVVFFYRRIDFLAVLRGSREAGVPFYLLPVIGLFFGAHWFLYFESIQLSSASLGILALSTYGVHVTWMGAVFSSRHTSGRDWVAVLCSALGAWVCAPAYDPQGQAFYGFMLGLLSAVFYAALPLLHQRARALSLPTRGTAQFFFAWLVFAPVASTQTWELDTRSWVALTALGVLCTFVAHNLWIEVTTAVRPATSGGPVLLGHPRHDGAGHAGVEEPAQREPVGGRGADPRGQRLRVVVRHAAEHARSQRTGERAAGLKRPPALRSAPLNVAAERDGDAPSTSGGPSPRGRSWPRWWSDRAVPRSAVPRPCRVAPSARRCRSAREGACARAGARGARRG